MIDNLSNDDSAEWISAAEASRLLAPVFKSEYLARRTVCKRAHAGLVRARAERFMLNDYERGNFGVPKGFWWAEGESALHQEWPTGDFDTWVDRGNTHLRAFGVHFLRADIEKMIPAAQRVGANEPTGWARVDRTVAEMRQRISSASNEEQFQAVGLLGRELLISAGQEVFRPEEHPTLDSVAASPTDANRMLQAYIAAKLAGSANEFVRKHAKAALDLAVHLQHRRTATYRDAALCVEATISVVNLMAIIAGLRDLK
jgi:hypothetical protein